MNILSRIAEYPNPWPDLIGAYSAPGRYYHNVDHLKEVLRFYTVVEALHPWEYPLETYLAVLYHDAVYDVTRKDNEERSAQLFLDDFKQPTLCGFFIDTGRVADLIRLTALHGKVHAYEVTPEEALFLDCDMSSMGAPWAVFVENNKNIDREYIEGFPNDQEKVLAGRKEFLRSLGARPYIFLSPLFHQLYEWKALDNLTRYLGTDDFGDE